MAEYFRMPLLGQTMEEGTILQWFKQEGDVVRKGDVLLEVMSDKANFEVDCTIEGVLRKILVPKDATVLVNAPIAILGSAGESIDSLLQGSGGPQTVSQPPVTVAETTAVKSVQSESAPVGERLFISPRAKRLAGINQVDPAVLAGQGSGPGGRVLERDVETYLRASAQPTKADRRVVATPVAARLAQEYGVNLESLSGSRAEGRITSEDVKREIKVSQPVAPVAVEAGRTIPYSGLRKMVGEAVSRSYHDAVHVSFVIEVDAGELQALYRQIQPVCEKSGGIKPTITDLLVRATAIALRDHPILNASLTGDRITIYEERNIGVAVAVEEGLLVPVLHLADKKSVPEIAAELRQKVERCRSGKQTADDLAGGTFTITNLGAFGIDSFDPIIVPPQSAILGVSAIKEKPVARDGQVVIRPMMNLSLSVDHRVVDGVPAARFLKGMKEIIEAPLLILI